MSHDATRCPKCGSAVPASAPICPRCIVARSFAHQDLEADAPADFGEYVIGELLGRGGMGTVFRARQKSLDREVALKLLPLELLDDEEFLERFEREARLMARLTHPGIARVFEAGISDGGQPYLAMELVAGEPITAFAKPLALRARLELFGHVCDAVQHAHQRGIIHRDLKPSNILADEQAVKVIDFGLARPAGDGTTDSAIWRSATHAVGTPAYMSPEQAAGAEVDTRTDVYSLGVLLCELIAGALPFADADLRTASREEIAKFIRETPTRRPSEILDATAFPAPPRVRDLRGDLDAVCLRAVAKIPADRYATVATLADDIARHLRCEPVSAVAPTVVYRVGKFARRNRGLLSVTTGVFVALAGASVFSASQAQTARRQRDAAELAQAKAERVKNFLAQLLAAPSPTVSGRDVRVVDVLATAKARAETDLADDPEVLAEMRVTLGNTYYELSLYDDAEPLLRAAVADHRRLFGNDAASTGTALNVLGGLCAWTSRTDEAIPLLAEAAAILRRHLPSSGHELQTTLQNLATAHTHAGNLAPAEAPLREALRVAEQSDGPNSAAATSIMGDLAGVLEDQGRIPEARAMMEKVIARMREIPTERTNLATMLGKWCDLVFTAGDPAGAERAMAECLEIRREVFGERTSPVSVAMGRLAYLHYRRGDFAGAENLARGGLEIQREIFKPGERELLFTLRPLGLSLVKLGRAAEAAPLLTECLVLVKQFAPGETKMIAELEAASGGK